MQLKKMCFAALVLGATGSPLTAVAADHNDSPLVKSAERSYVDITDVFLFRSPDDEQRIAIAVGYFSPEVAGTAQLFRSDADYEINIDTNNDYEADHSIHFSFDPPAADGSQTYVATGVPGVSRVTGTTTVGANAPVVSSTGGARVFAGLRDDPFFFDLDAFNAFVKAPCVPSAGLRCPGTGSPTNFFLGRDTATLVVDFAAVSLRGISDPNVGTVRVWAKAFEETAN